MFRRPKKPMRPRVVMMDSGGDEADDDMDFQETNDTISNNELKSTNSNASPEGPAVTKKSTLLSFGEEIDGEGEVFKVKKSSVSRRLLKERKKKDTKPKKNEILSALPTSTKESEEEDILKVTNFVRILTGREAEAVDMESGSEDEEDESQMRFKPRATADAVSEVLRRTLEEEKIPDATLIHEIRKKRQMARDTVGSGAAPFIPVDDSVRYKPTKSRLVRDDDNDQSEDDDEKRIDFTIDSTLIDKEKRREAFDAAQDEQRDRESESDSDQELEEWERQQIKKGVSQALLEAQFQLASQQQELMMTERWNSNGERMGPNSFVKEEVPSSRRLPAGSRIEDVMGGKTLRSVDSVIRQLNERLENLQLVKERHEGELSRLEVEAGLLVTELEESAESKQKLSARLVLYQGIHCYVHDLIDCLRCKIPEIQELENRLLGLLQAHAEFLMKRRRQDRDDQYEECSAALRIPTNPALDQEGEEREKRGAERKGRRTRRRREREEFNIFNHNEGLSTDDEELELDIQRFRNIKDGILGGASRVFMDVEEDYCEVEKVLQKFQEWKIRDLEAYRESYVPICIPKILSPLLRLHLLYWDPLCDEVDIFRTGWMKSLLCFGFTPTETRETVGEDPDVKLVPNVNEKILIPWIERLVTAEFDPVSTKQTKRLIHIVRKLLTDYTININSKQIHSLLKTILKKLEEATDKDVFIPMFEKNVLVKNSEVNVFSSRQFYASVKLLDNISSWTGLVSEKPLQTLALDKLLARYIVSSIGLTHDLPETLQRTKAVVAVLPRIWLSCGQMPNGIRHLVRTLILILQERTDFTLAANRNQIIPIANLLRTLGATDEADIVIQKYS